MMSNTEKSIPREHLFGRWRFDAGTGDLFDGKTTTRLEPQVAKLLDYFLVHQNKLITRDELIAEVWQERIVSYDAINRCISILRQTFPSDDRNAYIETVVRRGFISHFPAAPPEEGNVAPAPKRRSYWVFAALFAVVAVVLYALFANEKEPSPNTEAAIRKGPPMVAVLPFATFGQAGDSEFFAKGMHDDLLTQLAQLESIRVISRTSVLEYRGTSQNIREIGKELGADAILEGSIQSSSGQIRINVQLIDAASDEHLWAGTYDRELSTENIFNVQAEIAQSIAASMRASLTAQDTTQLQVLPTDNMAAYRAYHKALEIKDTVGVSNPAYPAALEKAVELDPSFVRAWAELAGVLSFENFSQQNPDSIQHAEEILERIRALAPDSADFLIAQAYYTYYIVKNYDQAYELVKRAQKLRPSDERVVELKSWIERRLGNFDARIESIRLARRLDPRNPIWTTILVQNLIVNHQYDEASQEVANAALPGFDLAVLGVILQLRETYEPARWAGTLDALEMEYGESVGSRYLWDARIASRDYAAAEAVLNVEQAANQFDTGWPLGDVFRIDEITTYWFLQASDRLDSLLDQVRAEVEEKRNADGGFDDTVHFLTLAFVSAAEGNTEETERLVRVWQRTAVTDLADMTNRYHYACRALGMAAATRAAVSCIRKGLVKPSLVIPFIEPYLPYYDSIRDTPEFTELLAGIGEAGPGQLF